jgi:DNA replication protein DnaC
MQNEIELTESEKRFQQISEILNSQNIDLPKNYSQKLFSNFETNSDILKRIVESLKKIEIDDTTGVWFSGSAGVGKTHLLIALMNQIAWKYYEQNSGRLNGDIRFWSYSDLCSAIRSDPNNFQNFRAIRSPRFLFIDDIGTSKTTDIIQEKIYSLFNYRMENELPTFVTTNLTIDEIGAEFNERLTSRLRASSVFIPLQNISDYRTKSVKSNFLKMFGGENAK